MNPDDRDYLSLIERYYLKPKRKKRKKPVKKPIVKKQKRNTKRKRQDVSHSD